MFSMRRFHRCSWIFPAVLAWHLSVADLARAQEPDNRHRGRRELWAEARTARASRLEPPARRPLENALYQFEERRILERFQQGFQGFHPKLGGLATGSGFAAGTEFVSDGNIARDVLLRVSAQASLAGYQLYEVQLGLGRLSGGRLNLDLVSRYRNHPQEDFFGIGPDSNIDDRTNFRFEQAEVIATAGWRLIDGVTVGVSGGFQDTHAGRGTDDRFPSIEAKFDTDAAPALDAQPSYVRAGAFMTLDTRDSSSNPRNGGYYHVEWTAFEDTRFDRFDFERIELELRQYLPFLNQRRVIAFRAKTSLTATGEDQQLPFFMAPALGGSDDLRGFREFRFRDRNLLVMNLEYRWEAFSGLDLALFADAGKVFARRAELDFSGLEAAYGMGARFNSASGVFMRIDTGFSHEGRHVFVKFGHAF